MATAPNQGIMALPESQQMQAPSLSLSDSYDAMQQGLMQARPDAAMELEEALAEIRPELDELTDEQLAQLIEAVQGLYGDPENYAKEVADMVAEELIDADDLPPEYNEEFLATLLMVLVDAQRSRMATAGSEQPMPEAPMGMAPMGMMPPQGFARGGIAEAARMVANRGRRGDTMLAHITPSEARMLRARGGSGTINPETGLPEFFIKKIFKAVKKTFKRVGKVLKKVLSSPIGRILGTIALGMVLGPAVMTMFPSLATATGTLTAMGSAVTGALASGTAAALGGGDLKSVLTSAATGFLGAPGGPLSNFVGKYTGVTNAAGNAAITGAIVGTGAGLVTGQNLKNSLKAGLTDGIISAGMAYMSGAPKVEVDNVAKTAAADAADAAGKGSNLIDLETQSYIDQNLPTTQQRRGAASQPFPSDVPKATPPAFNVEGLKTADGGIFGTSQAAQAQTLQGANRQMIPGVTTDIYPSGSLYKPRPVDPNPMSFDGYGGVQVGDAPVPYKQPGVMESLGEMGGGAKRFMTGDFSEGASQFYKGAENLFAPGPSSAQEKVMIDDYLAKNPTKSVSDAIRYVDKISPGMMRTYGPTVAAGIGALALSGGFDVPNEPAREKSPTGEDLIKQTPKQYLVQGLPGIQYDEQGNIIGSNPYTSQYTMADIRVPSAYGGPAMFAQGGIAALAQGGYPRKVGQISGPGTEKSDSIPAMLSDGEFVMTARAVRGAGGGSRREGAKRMYALMHQLERNAARG